MEEGCEVKGTNNPFFPTRPVKQCYCCLLLDAVDSVVSTVTSLNIETKSMKIHAGFHIQFQSFIASPTCSRAPFRDFILKDIKCGIY